MRRRVILACALLGYGLLAACATVLDLEPPPNDGGSPSTDGSTVDVSTIPCAPLDAQPSDGEAPATYYPFSYVEYATATYTFQFFNLTMLPSSTFGDASLSFAGGTFDGTYVYFATESPNGVIARHQADASLGSSWAAFDPMSLPGVGRQPFEGAVFDGRYVYFVPHGNDALRYDTASDASFTSASGWSAFDVTGLNDGGKAPYFSGAAFDGRYVYFAPHQGSVVARYDTKPPPPDAGVTDAGADVDAAPPGPFSDPTHWATYDTSNAVTSSVNYRGTVFDGRFVYFVPQGGVTLLRYDTAKPFTAGTTSWVGFDVSTLSGGPNSPKDFSGGVFDGRFIYLIPEGVPSVVVRYDTTHPINVTSSYAMFDVSTALPATDSGTYGFLGGAFDGRFVYLVPIYGSGNEVVRYDTQSPFTAPCSWEAYDIGQKTSGLSSLWGAVYDGHTLFYVPRGPNVMTYTSKTPASMPPLPEFFGSFF